MSERSLVDYVLCGMRMRWDKPVKHADAFTAGVADLSGWIDGVGTVWVELKAIEGWPKRAGTPVKFGLDDLQRDFLVQRRGWLFVRVGREYLLFDRAAISKLVDRPQTTQQMLRTNACAIWRNKVNWEEFSSWLSLKQS